MTAYKGLGTYGNGVGVVTPADHKGDQAGQVVKANATTIRPGLFWTGTGTIVTGTAGMSYSVAPYNCVTTRGAAFGAVFGGNDGTLSVATTAAPGSNSRIDVVYHWHREFSLDGVDSNPVIGVVQGTAAASPTEPSLAAFPGAIKLATIVVPAGVTATNSGTTITQTAPFTAMDGGRVPVRTTTERDAGTWLESQLIWLIDTDTVQVTPNGTSWVGLDRSSVVIPPAGTGITVDATTGEVTLNGTNCIVSGWAVAGEKYVVEVMSDITVSAAATLSLILRDSGGSDIAGANTYVGHENRISGGGGPTAVSLAYHPLTTSAAVIDGPSAGRITLTRMADAARTTIQSDIYSNHSTVNYGLQGYTRQTSTTVATGFRLTTVAGTSTITGKIRIRRVGV